MPAQHNEVTLSHYMHAVLRESAFEDLLSVIFGNQSPPAFLSCTELHRGGLILVEGFRAFEPYISISLRRTARKSFRPQKANNVTSATSNQFHFVCYLWESSPCSQDNEGSCINQCFVSVAKQTRCNMTECELSCVSRRRSFSISTENPTTKSVMQRDRAPFWYNQGIPLH